MSPGPTNKLDQVVSWLRLCRTKALWFTISQALRNVLINICSLLLSVCTTFDKLFIVTHISQAL